MNNWRLLQEHRRVSNIPNGPENIPLNRRIRSFSDLWRLARDKNRTRPQIDPKKITRERIRDFLPLHDQFRESIQPEAA